eukprot:TRINITY_DN51259_c0_g1_i2.p1 TRINITY_DN51259_c0_g1~~TRINITY_DN51259_c0_g1_i2.p1  ORF type:complete len:110 (-),score=18.82 TRINITY_DN51259_c0_g1_i2:303-632(-)
MMEACALSLLSTMKKLDVVLQSGQLPCDEHFEGLTQEIAIALEYTQLLAAPSSEEATQEPRAAVAKDKTPHKPKQEVSSDADKAFELIDSNADGVITREEFASKVTISA